MTEEKTIESIHRYPGSDRVRVKYADGNVRFFRGELPAEEPLTFSLEVKKDAIEEVVAAAVAELKAELLNSPEAPPDGGGEEAQAGKPEQASEPEPPSGEEIM